MRPQTNLRFSVLMSVYAKEKAIYLDKALKSILLTQTHRPDELVLIADGHLTPQLYSTISKYQKLYQNFIFIQLDTNKGLSQALNVGLKFCSYEWVARMDSDDISLPNRFEKQIGYLQMHPEIDVLGTALSEYNIHDNKIIAIKRCPEDISTYIKFRSPVNHPTVIYKKSSVIKAGGYINCPYMEDYHLWIRMYAMGMKITSLSESLYLFKMDPNVIKRRGGIVYFKSEIAVQKLLLRLQITTLPRCILNITLRCTIRLMPNSLRLMLYKYLLRNTPDT